MRCLIWCREQDLARESSGGERPSGSCCLIEGGDRITGRIQLDYGVIAFPATYIVAPDGTISTVLMTPIDDKDDIAPYIEDAREA